MCVVVVLEREAYAGRSEGLVEVVEVVEVVVWRLAMSDLLRVCFSEEGEVLVSGCFSVDGDWVVCFSEAAGSGGGDLMSSALCGGGRKTCFSSRGFLVLASFGEEGGLPFVE